MASDDFAHRSREWVGRLLEFRCAMVALAGFVVFGGVAGCEFAARAWIIGAVCGLPALLCGLIVAFNILVEAAEYALLWLRALGTVLALPLLMVPSVRRRVDRMWLSRNEMDGHHGPGHDRCHGRVVTDGGGVMVPHAGHSIYDISTDIGLGAPDRRRAGDRHSRSA